MPGRHQAGFTLIELVVAIVLIASAAATIVGVTSAVSVRSADAMLELQAANIADAYLREILAKPFADPDAGGEIVRSTFDDIDDYNMLNDNGAQDQFGNAIAGMEQYQVNVAVTATALGVIPAAQARLITVTVTGANGAITMLSGFKTEDP